MNEIKTQGQTLEILIKRIGESGYAEGRWLAIGATDLQKGLMALTRAVAKPEFF